MKNILKIQELERKISSLKSNPATNKVNAYYEQIRKNRKVIVENLNSIEQSAGAIASQYEKINSRFEQLNAKSQIVSKQKPEMVGINNIGALVEDANYLTSELAKLEQKMRELNDKSSRLLNEYNSAMNDLRDMTAKQNQIKKQMDDEEATALPQIQKFEAEIKKLETSVDKELYNKYKTLKKDIKLPVFVHLKNNRCGACQMEQSLNFIQRLKQAGMLPCEECRRMILSDD
jgi:predicted  nucleic acid-binding Zn-ribbon protein